MNSSLNIKATLLALAGTCVTLPAAAQLHESINVDGRYIPDIIRIDRINAFPKALKSTLATSPLNYEERGITASFNPSLVTLPATGWRTDRHISSNPGYLELGAGSWLNSTLSAGYRFIDNSSTLFGVRLQHNSTSLWKPDMSAATEDVKQFRYDESIGLYASHVVKDMGRIDAALDYHVGYFNYYGYAGPLWMSDSRVNPVDAPGQTINDVALRVDWRSLVSASSSFMWNVAARMRHFAYRSMPLSDSSGAYEERTKGSRETNVGFEGGVRMPWDNGSSIGIDANLDMEFITNADVDNYGMLTFTPYYRFSKGLLDIRLGADLDLSFNAGEEGHRYSFIHVAPDVRFGVQTGHVGVYLDLLGGSELNTLARLHQLDYYNTPRLFYTRPTYTPLDATFGINLGPFSGFSLGVKARYKASKNVPLGGWYTAFLDYNDSPVPGLIPTPVSGSQMDYLDNGTYGMDIHGYSVSGHMAYQYGDRFAISLEGSCQPQKGKKGFFNGYDRPKITASAKAWVRPVAPLKIGAGYDFRGKRDIYTSCSSAGIRSGIRTVIIDGGSVDYYHLPLPDLTLLNVSASWDFTKDFTFWVQANNILNRHDAILPMQPSQGLVVMAGLKLLF